MMAAGRVVGQDPAEEHDLGGAGWVRMWLTAQRSVAQQELHERQLSYSAVGMRAEVAAGEPRDVEVETRGGA